PLDITGESIASRFHDAVHRYREGPLLAARGTECCLPLKETRHTHRLYPLCRTNRLILLPIQRRERSLRPRKEHRADRASELHRRGLLVLQRKCLGLREQQWQLQRRCRVAPAQAMGLAQYVARRNVRSNRAEAAPAQDLR